VNRSYLLQLENGQPADQAVFVDDQDAAWAVDDWFTARDGSRWRIVSIEAAPPQLADEGFEATWVVEPLD
jgi:hypothetical protein